MSTDIQRYSCVYIILLPILCPMWYVVLMLTEVVNCEYIVFMKIMFRDQHRFFVCLFVAVVVVFVV